MESTNHPQPPPSLSLNLRRRRRPLSLPSSLHHRSVFTALPRTSPSLRRHARRLYSAHPYSTRHHPPGCSGDLAVGMVSNIHGQFADCVASNRMARASSASGGRSSGTTGMGLLPSDRHAILSPHRGAVATLDFDNDAEGRFLIAGGSDGTISVYDVGLEGSEYVLEGGVEGLMRKHHRGIGSSNLSSLSRKDASVFEDHRRQLLARHPPLARSTREPPSTALTHIDDIAHLPSGHGVPVSTVQWYATDTGAFVSTDRSGQILIWDTNAFVPVSTMRLPGSIRCAKMPRCYNNGHGASSASPTSTLLAVGLSHSPQGQDRSVRLCDLRSGATSHELVGHGPRGGVNAVAWNPMQEFGLVSGGEDGSVRLWDVRKSGSGACLAVLDREVVASLDGAGTGDVQQQQSSKKRKMAVGPSDYSAVEKRHVQSHGGPVTSVSYAPDGTTLVTTGMDRKVTVWDVDPSQANGQYAALPTLFLGPDERQHPIDPGAGRRMAATIIQPGSRGTAMLWMSGPNSTVLGYGIRGPGGRPDVVLSGHLDSVRSLVCQENALRVFSGGSDGMILAWGCPDVEGTDDPASDYFARVRQRQRRRNDSNADRDNWY